MNKTYWVVDDFFDMACEKTFADIEKRNTLRAGHAPLLTYDSRESAWEYIIQRAKVSLGHAEKALKGAQARVKKCEKRMLAKEQRNG